MIEVHALDRPGLLFDLARGLSDLGLDIAWAHIATFGEKAFDVFYVRDRFGKKQVSGKIERCPSGNALLAAEHVLEVIHKLQIPKTFIWHLFGPAYCILRQGLGLTFAKIWSQLLYRDSCTPRKVKIGAATVLFQRSTRNPPGPHGCAVSLDCFGIRWLYRAERIRGHGASPCIYR